MKTLISSCDKVVLAIYEGILTEPILAAFGGVLRQLRTESQLTQEEFAFAAGLQRNHVSSLELGNKQPTLITIYKISLALNMTPGRLLDRVDAVLPDMINLRGNVIRK